MPHATDRLTVAPKATAVKSTDAELRVAFQGPALLSNRFFISFTTLGIRISFAEQNGDIVEPQFRTAVVLSIQDGEILAEVLGELIRENAKATLSPGIEAKSDAKEP